MKHYILAIVLLFSLAAPAMAAELTANQISYEEMWVNGTGFDDPSTVTLSTMTNISVKPSPSGIYSYEITGMILPGDSILKLNASPVKDELELYVQRYWPLAWTFDENCGRIGYSYDAPNKTAHAHRSVPSLVKGRFQTIRVKGGTDTPSESVYLNVTVQRSVDGGSFNELVDIIAIPAGPYTIHATDGSSEATNETTIHAPGQLHHIEITDPENIPHPQTGKLTLNTTGKNSNYTFGATGYDLERKVVQNVAFVWWSSNPYAGSIISTGYFETDNVGHTEVYAKSGAKESNHVIVYVNAPMANTTLASTNNFTLESGDANVTGTFNRSVNGTATVKPVGNVTANTTVGLSADHVFTSGAVVNVSGDAHNALEAGNCTVTITLCISDVELRAMGLARSNVQMYVYHGSAWIGLTTTRIGTTDCYTADISNYLSEAMIGIGSKPAPSSGGGSGGGGSGTYPPGWSGTPTQTPAVSPTATTQPGVTSTPVREDVTPKPTKPAASGATQTASAKETPTKKKSAPGFPAVFAIAGMLAIAYMVLRQRR
ncbi:MAG: PGF-CTERM sorting domain-containing protein [Candidatus Methanogasteraceae archaeon]